MNKLEQAARQALEALGSYKQPIYSHAPIDAAITALREALDPELQFVRDWNEGKVRRVSDGKIMGVAEQAAQEPSCNQHPDAPHGFARNASHNAGRYVCECEGWEPEQEPVAVVEITYGREPECYVTGNIDNFPEGVFKLYAAPVQQAEQEPMAWMVYTADGQSVYVTDNPTDIKDGQRALPLYAAPFNCKGKCCE